MKKSPLLTALLLSWLALMTSPQASDAAGSAAAAAVQAAAAVIPARHFARFETYSDLQLSPDGQHLAATARSVDGKYVLFILKPSQLKVVSSLRFGDDSVVGGVDWVSNSRVIVSLAEQSGSADAPAFTGELFGMNVDGSGKEYLFGYRGSGPSGTRIKAGNEAVYGFARFMGSLPQQPDEALVMMTTATQSTADGLYFDQSYTPLYRMNVYSGKLKELAKAPIRTPSWYGTDLQGRPRLVYGFGADSADPQTYWRDEQNDWQPVRIQGKGLRPLAVSGDGRQIYFLVEPKPDTRCLVALAIPVVGAESEKPLYCKPLDQLARVHFTHDGRPYGYSGRDIASFVLTDDEVLQGRVWLSLQDQFPGQAVSLASAADNQSVLIFEVRSDRNSGEFYLYEAASGKAAFLTARHPWIEPERMASVQTIRYAARDGLEIEALLTLPPGGKTTGLPMLVLPHGGPIGFQDRWGWHAEAQFFASRGYAVIQPNFRGSGGYGKEFERRGYREWGGKIIDDITDAARWAIEAGRADASRLCIYGGSYGGYAALMSVVREPTLYRCAIGNAGVYDLNLLVKDSDIVNRRSGQLFLAEAMAGSPEERTRQSPIHRVDQLRAAVMIVHGERDIRAPVSQAKALRRALEKNGKPYEWLVKSDEGHGFFNEDNRTEMLEKVAAFLDKHLAVRP